MYILVPTKLQISKGEIFLWFQTRSLPSRHYMSITVRRAQKMKIQQINNLQIVLNQHIC